MSDKLRILWIDDRETQVPVSLFPTYVTRFFDIVRCSDLLEIASYSGKVKGRKAEIPEFDIAATDFNLVPRDSRAATPDAVLELGMQADAAGFIIGLLLCSATPSRPKAVLPYSGDQNQFNDVWRLASAFSPPWVSVSTAYDVSKIERTPIEALKEMSATFRSSLRYHLRVGTYALDSATQHFLDKLEGNPKTSIDVTAPFVFKYQDGTRTIAAGALFHDQIESVRSGRLKSAASVTEYFSEALAISSDMRAATKLAQENWEKSNRLDALTTYRLASEVSKRSDRKREKDDADWMLVDKISGGAEIGCRAFLYACLRSYVAAVCLTDILRRLADIVDDESAVPASAIREKAKEELNVEANENYLWEALDELCAALKHVGHPTENLEQILDGLDQHPFLSSWEARLVRALDPTTKDAVVDLGGSDKVGRQASRLLTRSKTGTTTAATDLLKGKFTLFPDHLAVSRRLARRMVPRQCVWPPFLLIEQSLPSV